MFTASQWRHIGLIIFQLFVLILIWQVGYWIQQSLNLPISAAVIGLLLVLSLLLTGLFKLKWIKTGASFILGELVLLFIPCVVGVIKYKALFMSQGWQLILAVTLGTLIVMVVTAYTVYWGFKLEAWFKQKLQHKAEASLVKLRGEQK